MALSEFEESFVNIMTIREETSDTVGLEVGMFLGEGVHDEKFHNSIILSSLGNDADTILLSSDIPKLIEYLQGVLKEHNET